MVGLYYNVNDKLCNTQRILYRIDTSCNDDIDACGFKIPDDYLTGSGGKGYSFFIYCVQKPGDFLLRQRLVRFYRDIGKCVGIRPAARPHSALAHLADDSTRRASSIVLLPRT